MGGVKITSLELENVKRVRAVQIVPNEDGMTVIGGGNAQGKTSVLDAITYALGGERNKPTDLKNREGIADPRMEIHLSNGLVVTREGKNTSLKVTDPTGKKAGQTLLNSFIGEFSLNLPKFLELSPAEKGKVLLNLTGLEEQLKKLDMEEKKATDERYYAGQVSVRKKKYAEELEEYPEIEDCISADEISRKLQDVVSHNAEVRQLQRQQDELKRQVAEKTAYVEKARQVYEQAIRDREELEAKCAQAVSVSVGELQDESVIREELANMEEHNRKWRSNKDKQIAILAAKQAEEEWKVIDDQVQAIRQERMALISQAKMPMEGLSISDGELTYNGQRWDCMSSAEQMKVGAALCLALKPQCGFILIDKTEQLDRKELKAFNEWLSERNLQAICTRVADDDTCDIIIEDGQIVSERHESNSKMIGGF